VTDTTSPPTPPAGLPAAPAPRPPAAPPGGLPPLRFSFSTPSDWVQVDMSADGPAAARRFVERLVEGQPEGNRDKRREIQVAATFQGTVRKARRQGARMAAFWSVQAEGRLAGASVMVAIRPVPQGLVPKDAASPEEAHLAALERAVRHVTASGQDDGGSVIETGLVELPAGPARRVRRSQVVDALGSRHRTEVVQFFVLAPDQRQMVVITFSTPTLELAEPLAGLFDALACSLRWRP